jgi:putative transposase
VVGYVAWIAGFTGLTTRRILGWAGIQPGRYYDWKRRCGQRNRHNADVPRVHHLLDDERERILAYHDRSPQNGYRRLAYMMLDDDVVCAAPATVYRVLREAGLLDRNTTKPSKKGTGFKQPSRAHQHWHVDVAYLNIAGTFYYLCSVLDGFSRFVVHWEIHESMTEPQIELILQRGLEIFPGTTPRSITDNGPQFIAKDFKRFIRLSGMTHVRTSPYYPQSNGKIERWHRTMKTTIRPKAPGNLAEARDVMERFVGEYNHVRLHSAIGYITPADKLHGRADLIQAQRKRKLHTARVARVEASR